MRRVQVDTVRITLIQISRYSGDGTRFCKYKGLSYWQFAATTTLLVVSMCVVAEVKFQENPYYGRPYSSEGARHAIKVL